MGIFFKNIRSTGIHVTDRSIRVLEAVKSGDKLVISGKGEIGLRPGTVSNGRIKDQESLALALKEVMAHAKPIPIKPGKSIFAIDGIQTYSHIFEGRIDEHEIPAAVKKEIEMTIPLKTDDLAFAYDAAAADKSGLGSKGPKPGYRIATFSIPKNILSEWQNFFNGIGMEIEVFDIEILSLLRGIAPDAEKPFGLVNIGDTKATISLLDESGLFYAQDFYAGDEILDNGTAGSVIKGMDAVKPDRILSEIESAVGYYASKNKKAIQEIIIISENGNADMAIKQLNGKLPGIKLADGNKMIKKPLMEHGYEKAWGMSLRGIDREKYGNEPCFEGGYAGRLIFSKLSVKPGRFRAISLDKISRSPLAFAGIVLLLSVAAFWHIGSGSVLRTPENMRLAGGISNLHMNNIVVKLPVSVSRDLQDASLAKGRITEVQVRKAVSREEAHEEAMATAKARIEPGEILVKAPIIGEAENKSLVFPLTVRWLAINEAQAGELAKNMIREGLGADSPVIQSLEFEGIEITENSNIYYVKTIARFLADRQLPDTGGWLTGKINIDISDHKISKDNMAAKAPDVRQNAATVENKPAKITIIDLGDKRLNVREEPDKNSKIVRKARSGETYDLMEEKNGWYRIRLQAQLSGWIMEVFAKKTK